MPHWLNGWLKVNERQERELWIKSMADKENCELVYNEIFCANAKQFFRVQQLLSASLDLWLVQ